jgi:hypothetical protein
MIRSGKTDSGLAAALFIWTMRQTYLRHRGQG